MALTPKQRRFVEEYLVALNATQAAIRAGYSSHTAGQQGERLLKNVEIASAVAEAQHARSLRTGITADRVLAELARIGFADIRKAVRWRSNVTAVGVDPETDAPQYRAFNEVEIVNSAEIDSDTAAAIAEVSQTREGSLKVKFHDKRGALELLGKHLGLFDQKAGGDDPGRVARDIQEAQREIDASVNGPSIH